jgi:hypothetical protein
MGEQLVSNCWRSCMRTLYAPTHTEGKRETATGFVSYEATPIHETDRRANGFEYVARGMRHSTGFAIYGFISFMKWISNSLHRIGMSCT